MNIGTALRSPTELQAKKNNQMHPNNGEIKQLPEEARVEVTGKEPVTEASDIVKVADNHRLHDASNSSNQATEEPDRQRRPDCVENADKREIDRRFWDAADEGFDPLILDGVVTLENQHDRLDPTLLDPPVKSVPGVPCEPVSNVLIPADPCREDAVCTAP